MEGKKSKYDIKAIKKAFNVVGSLNITRSARQGARTLSFSDADVIETIQSLKTGNFHKAMTSHNNSSIWQDVYHAAWKEKSLYVKFTTDSVGDLLLISFKEK